MFGSDQQIYLAQQQQQQQYHIARYQQEQIQQRMRAQQQQQQYPSRLQYQGSHRYFENSTQQQQLTQSQQGPAQQLTSQNSQNEQQSQQNHRSNNSFNPQNNNNGSFQNHRGKQQHNRDYNNRGEKNTHRKNNRNNQNGSNNNNGKKSANNNNNNNNNNNGSGSGRLLQTKSEITFHDRKNATNGRSNSNESQNNKSASSTPPSSVKSLSPLKSLMTKSLEMTTLKDELRISYTSNSNSLLSTNNNNSITTVESLTDDSISTSSGNSLGILTGAGDGSALKDSGNIVTDTSSKESTINSWINANNQFSGIHNGLSASAEQLNMRPNDYHHHHHQMSYRKRPPSASAVSLPPREYEMSLSYEYYLTRIYHSDIQVEPPNLRSNTQYDLISKQIWERYTLFQQTPQTFRNKIHVWRELHEFIKGFQYFQNRSFPRWGLYLVGSTITGFGLDTSDVDMCLVMKSSSHLDPRSEAMVTLSALKTYLINIGNFSSGPFQGFTLINAKVPILRFRDISNLIEVDLNYNNCIGVRNTHLLYCYAQIDWRLRPLVIMVKLWAQFHNINDARNGTISSYSLVLMVIFFLQHAVKPKVLPCLHKLYPEKFQIHHDISTIDMMEKLDHIDWKAENTKPIGELFLRFLDYYHNFDYHKNAISVRTAELIPIEECRAVRTPKNEPSHWQTLCIEEPFDLTNTARSTYDWEVFNRIRGVFFQSWKKLNETKNVDSLFQESLFVHSQPSSHQQYIHQINAQVLQEVKYYINQQTSTTQQQQPLNPPILSPAVAVTANKSPAEITS